MNSGTIITILVLAVLAVVIYMKQNGQLDENFPFGDFHLFPQQSNYGCSCGG